MVTWHYLVQTTLKKSLLSCLYIIYYNKWRRGTWRYMKIHTYVIYVYIWTSLLIHPGIHTCSVSFEYCCYRYLSYCVGRTQKQKHHRKEMKERITDARVSVCGHAAVTGWTYVMSRASRMSNRTNEADLGSALRRLSASPPPLRGLGKPSPHLHRLMKGLLIGPHWFSPCFDWAVIECEVELIDPWCFIQFMKKNHLQRERRPPAGYMEVFLLLLTERDGSTSSSSLIAFVSRSPPIYRCNFYNSSQLLAWRQKCT